MESSASLRSFHYVGTVSHPQSSLEMPGMVSMYYASKSDIQGLTFGGKLFHASRRQRGAPVSCVKSSESTEAVKPNGSLDSLPNGSLEKKPLQNVTFPSGFEALVLEVCDETQIAELKLKVGEFEMHLKRNIGVTKAPLSGISPTTPPPIPTKPMVESAPSAPSPSPPKSSPKKTSPFTNPFGNSSKLAALEASGAKGYVLVPSPTVGSFHRGRTVKGRRQPPICNEGDLIKEGQVIGYLDQFGTELPVKSDVAGEVLKLLFNEGDAVGYGDPLIAVLPAFHGIN